MKLFQDSKFCIPHKSQYIFKIFQIHENKEETLKFHADYIDRKGESKLITIATHHCHQYHCELLKTT